MSALELQPARLPRGGRINRSQAIQFSFNGQQMQGFQGDTLASALLANNVSTVGRSFKYSRRRGIVGQGAEEPNAIVQIGRGPRSIPNLRATQVEIYGGMEAFSVSGWPSVDFDLSAIFGLFSRLMPPGFYYKTFMRPKKLWMTYEHWIRKAAGLGRAPRGRDPDVYDKINHHCDVLIVGAGPAGLSAALAAARTGARVIIADEQSEFGGALLSSRVDINGEPASQWLLTTCGELESLDNVSLLPRSTVFGYYDQNFLAVVERRFDHLGIPPEGQSRQRLHRVRAGRVVLATGAIERPVVFAANDLPGVMMASAISCYVNRFAVAPGSKLLLFTSNDSAYQCALDWTASGRELVGVIDSRENPRGPMVEAVRAQGTEVMHGHCITEAIGRKKVCAALVAPIDTGGKVLTGPTRRIECDLIGNSGGWSPTIHLSSHTGARPEWSDQIVGFLPGKLQQAASCAGAVNGQYSLQSCLSEGAEKGAQAAKLTGFGEGPAPTPVPGTSELPEHPPQALFLSPHSKPTSRAPAQFVDMQLDVTAASIELAAREGYESVEHVKRYTAMGFGTDQGKLGNINGMAILASALKQTIAETGTTIFRPAYTPVTFGAIAGSDVGALFDPERYTAMHHWHLENQAQWENVGQWKRPWYFPKPGEDMHQAVARECLAVRRQVGILDASTLGKIDIQGPDAAEFISRVYTNAFLKLAPGKCRYGLMLKEDGMIFDDGVTACLGENHYLMHTTTGNAAAILGWLELWHQTEWPELQVYFTSVTDHWATATISGPDARKVAQKVCSDVDFSGQEFPFMDWRAGTVAGIAARIFRISFTGELSYEFNVPAQYGRFIWEKLIAAGEEFGITPYGTEAMHVLRAEKGFIIVGQDTDGSMTPADMNMNWVVNNKKTFSFIGKRSLARSDCQRDNRKQLVGLKTLQADTVLPEGAQIVNNPDEPMPMRMLGHVTSSYHSAALGHAIALAVVKGGHNRMGDLVHCPLADGSSIAAEIVSPVFYDPDGERQHV
jgi:sarcosine oxidase, subunit alpha